MRYKKVLLLNANYQDNYFDLPPELTVGLGYLAEALKNEGIDYDVMDMDLGYKFSHLKEKILSFCPDLIGMSMMSLGYKENYQTLRKIKKKFPDIDIVTGGPHISTIREDVLRECEAIDFAIEREGEISLLDLCKGKDISEIKGLFYRRNNEIGYTSDNEFITDLDSIPFPKYEKFEIEKYEKFQRGNIFIPLISSRGCPFFCIYCSAFLSVGKKFRYRSPENVVDEIEYWYQRGIRKFRISDDNFTLKKDRVHKICDEIKRRNIAELSISCDNGVRADKIDKDLLKKMKEVGFYRIDFGVEGGNNKILRNLKKGEKIETIDNAIKLAWKTGFEIELTFLIGAPGEKWEDIKDSVNLAFKYPISSAIWYHIIPYPRTELYEWLKKNDYLLENPQHYLNKKSRRKNQPLFITPELPFKERKKAWKYTRKIRKKIITHNAKRKLKRLGILGSIFAHLYGNFLLRNIFIENKIVRKFLVQPVKKMAHTT